MFFSPFRQLKPIAVPRPVVLSTGSNGLVDTHGLGRRMQRATYIGRDLHFRLDRYRDAAQPLYHCSEDLLPLNCCNCSAAQLAVHKDSSGFEGNLIRQRHSRRFCLETCSCRLTMEPSPGECQALRARPEREVCNPQIHLLHLPQHVSRLEARKTDKDNAKQQKERKIEDNSNCSQPLRAQASHPVFKQAGERPALRSPGWNHRCPRSNKRHFFIAQSRGWPRPMPPYISYGRNLQTCLNRPELSAALICA